MKRTDYTRTLRKHGLTDIKVGQVLGFGSKQGWHQCSRKPLFEREFVRVFGELDQLPNNWQDLCRTMFSRFDRKTIAEMVAQLTG